MDAGPLVCVVVLATALCYVVTVAGWAMLREIGRRGEQLERADQRTIDRDRDEILMLRDALGIPTTHVADAPLIFNHLPTEAQEATPAGPLPANPTAFRDLDLPDGEWDDPTDLTQPLDALPDDIPPQGDMGWSDAEPVAFAEPIPEGEHRPRVAGIGVNENPLEELGITPAWREQ